MSDNRLSPFIALAQSPLGRRLWRSSGLLALYSCGVTYFTLHVRDVDTTVTPFTALGTVLGLFLAFRMNTAYDRWWEGRKLWGQLVNDSRNLCIKIKALETIPYPEAHHAGRLLVNFARALKEHLREGIKSRQLSVYRAIAAEPQHVPAHIAGMLREKIRGWRNEGWIDGFDEMMLDPHARALMDICGSCERIRKTPLTHSYTVFIRQCIALYLLSLPWGLTHYFRYATPLALVVVGYFMIGMELIAGEVEEPFGRAVDDLMLDDICMAIEASITEILTPSPEPEPRLGP